MLCRCCLFFFCFKQKTAYEMRISDWSSDVCSSDLTASYAIAPCPEWTGVPERRRCPRLRASPPRRRPCRRGRTGAKASFSETRFRRGSSLDAGESRDPIHCSDDGRQERQAVLPQRRVVGIDGDPVEEGVEDRKSTRLNSSH